MKDTEDKTRHRSRRCGTAACRAQGVCPDISSPPCQVPTSRECVGFGAVQEVPVGLVQPASAAVYDYYNPGEHLGGSRQVWNRCPHMGHQEGGSVPVAVMSPLGQG